MLEGVEFTVSHAPMEIIKYIRIIITIAFAESMIVFILDISNAFQNTILPNPEDRVYISLQHLYMEWFRRKLPKHTLSSNNPKEPCIQAMKSTQ